MTYKKEVRDECVAQPIFVGKKVVWGIPKEKKPIAGIPDGYDVKTRFRKNGVGKAFIRSGNSITENVLVDKEDHWELLEIGRNDIH